MTSHRETRRGLQERLLGTHGRSAWMALTSEEWLNGRLAKLIGASKKIVDNGPTTDYKHHTALKLVAIQYYAETFTKVVRKQVQGESSTLGPRDA